MSSAQREGARGKAMPTSVRRGLDSPSRPLDVSVRRAMEPRFGHDFSRVRIHSGGEAARSARAVGAQAYVVGSDVVFGAGRYNPGSSEGQTLLAHELTHVVQQAAGASATGRLEASTRAQESEAERMAAGGVGSRQTTPRETGGPVLARFSDTNHHIVEEAALERSGLTAAQIKGLEQGNVQRDYSQLPAAVNLALLGQATTFGGYSPDEHIDNFIFDVEHDRWRGRGVGPQKYRFLDPKHEEFGPIEHIAAQLRELARGGSGPENMNHLGSAFHTVEDFFAHSNFVELIHGDERFGKDLLTASVTTEAGNEASALAEVQGSVAPASMQPYYAAQGEAAAKKTEATSHANMNKDTAQSRNFAEARRLAALVIQELAADVIGVMAEKDPAKREQRMQEVVVAKIRHYLRPPNPKDPWWEGLTSHGAGASMDARLAEADKRTPVTVNHKPFSPLRNMEASKNSPMALPVGVAFSMGKYGFLQAGAGFTRPDSFDSRFVPPPAQPDQKSSPILGAQWTGHF